MKYECKIDNHVPTDKGQSCLCGYFNKAHNDDKQKQVGEVLNRLLKEFVWGEDMGGEISVYRLKKAIEAERNKLNNSDGDVK